MHTHNYFHIYFINSAFAIFNLVAFGYSHSCLSLNILQDTLYANKIKLYSLSLYNNSDKNRNIILHLSDMNCYEKDVNITRMTTFIKTKFKVSDDQCKVQYRIWNPHRISKSKKKNYSYWSRNNEIKEIGLCGPKDIRKIGALQIRRSDTRTLTNVE